MSDLPLLNTDLEAADGAFPPAVEAFRDRVRGADCFLFASPDYNYSISGPLKNALDWASRPPNRWGDRAAAILSASGWLSASTSSSSRRWNDNHRMQYASGSGNVLLFTFTYKE
ncbi:unnamed protein product [Miscanthus lutarioriparius]|uniref:NAD(P)H dehydrogenase (quinone) n=1 Tax=Miscanthus lutarioriparius TaxID=422564 RepID=A0A811P5Z0_9POAL|nr:unnamed protein product [Miscanthus lutarioriparius]